MIRPGTFEDLDQVEQIYNSIIDWEEKHGAFTVFQRGVYPTKVQAESALKEGSLYVLEKDGRVLGSLIINHDQFPEYRNVEWKTSCPDDQVLVVYLICVSPEEASKGLGEKLMLFTFDEARRRGCRTVRLDTTERNLPSRALYKKMGFSVAAAGPMKVGRYVEDKTHLFFEKNV